ncbi:MAG: RluA family pseudouridine synthase [Phycisphaerales bacterium]|nr:RluA family pseudouridine synthase [Phycisphaerales bacterium]
MPKPKHTLEIIRQTPDWVAVNKPAGLAVIPGRAETDSVIEALGRQLGLPSSGTADPRVRVCHRLDKDTTGVLLFALNSAAQRNIGHQFQHHTVAKEYLALVIGRPLENAGTVSTQIGPHPTDKLRMAVVKHGGRPAVTGWAVEERYREFSLVRLFPETGKTHQIRVHMAHLGHPLVVDPLYHPKRYADGLYLSRFKMDYRPSPKQGKERPLIARLPLHADRLAFDDPAGGGRIELHAPPPKDFRATVNMLSRHGK